MSSINRRLVVIMKLKVPKEKFRDTELSVSSHYQVVGALEEAISACMKFILDHNIREEEWEGGYVFANTSQVASIDYHGNISKPREAGFRSFF